jgi:hypothetical protein
LVGLATKAPVPGLAMPLSAEASPDGNALTSTAVVTTEVLDPALSNIMLFHFGRIANDHGHWAKYLEALHCILWLVSSFGRIFIHA